MLVDSHCHIPMISHEGGVDAILEEAAAHQVEHMLCVAVDLESYPEILQLAHNHACISASVGVHPNTELKQPLEAKHLLQLAEEREVVAIGETGLDYFRSNGDLEWQRERFRTHIRVAREVAKPLIIHCREAAPDLIDILCAEHAEEIGGVMYCFAEDWEVAQRAMELGFYISFSGIVTFKNAQALKDVARRVPLEKMLVETDSPYLAPMPYRGRQNRPAFVRHVAEHIAGLREVSFEEIASATTSNYYRLFSK